VITGVLLSLAIALVAWLLGQVVPVLGAPLIAIVLGMTLSSFFNRLPKLKPGIDFAAKKVLQYAIILLGFGLNIALIATIGREALLVLVGAISAGLLVAYFGQKIVKLPGKVSTLIGVGSAICRGSAIAATAPVIDADEDEVAQAISVVVFFNVLAIFIFPIIGQWLGMTAQQFGIFAGAAINDTSSVTAAAALWDNAHQLGTTTLETAVTVKLIRTLAIIPITLFLSYRTQRVTAKVSVEGRRKIPIPSFILWFIVASIIASVFNLPDVAVSSLQLVSRFLIVTAMAAIGLKTNPVKLVKSSPRPLLLGLGCSLSIIAVTLVLSQVTQRIWY